MSIRMIVFGIVILALVSVMLDTTGSGHSAADDTGSANAGYALYNSDSAAENRTPTMPVQPFDKFFTNYFTYPELTTHLQKLVKLYPDLMSIEDLTLNTPHGATWQGRSVWGVKISDGVSISDPTEPKVLIIGNVHGDEWMGTEVCMYLIYHLLENYGLPPTDNDNDGAVNEDPFNGKDDDGDKLIDEDWSEGQSTYLVNNREIWVVPMPNPDGVSIDMEMAQTNGGIWRKNARDNNENGVFDSDYDGVDMNRNFAYQWNANQQGIISSNGVQYRSESSLPSSSTYRGPQDNRDEDGDSLVPLPDLWDPRYREDRNGIDEDPWDGLDNDGDGNLDEDRDGGFSEPETQALELLMNRLDSDGNHHNMRSDVGISIDYHSYGGWVIWPWGYTYNVAPHEELLVSVGSEFMARTGYASWWDDGLYLTAGDSDDWLYGTHGALAFTIELNDEPNAGFHAPTELIINTSRKLLSCNLYAAEMTGSARIARELNYPDLDIGTPVITYEQKTFKISNTRPYSVTATIENTLSLDPNSVMLHYRIGEVGTYRTIKMRALITANNGEVSGATHSGPIKFAATIPALPDYDDINVYYYMTCADVRGPIVSSPQYGEGEPYRYYLDAGLGFSTFDAAVAVIMAAIFIALVWGGFFKGVHIAIKADRRKAFERA